VLSILVIINPSLIPALFNLPVPRFFILTPDSILNLDFSTLPIFSNVAPKAFTTSISFFTTLVFPSLFLRVTASTFSFSSRNIVTFILSPGRCKPTSSCNSGEVLTGDSLILVIMSPSLIPADAAAPPGVKPFT
jgi:hypothetical protein